MGCQECIKRCNWQMGWCSQVRTCVRTHARVSHWKKLFTPYLAVKVSPRVESWCLHVTCINGGTQSLTFQELSTIEIFQNSRFFHGIWLFKFWRAFVSISRSTTFDRSGGGTGQDWLHTGQDWWCKDRTGGALQRTGDALQRTGGALEWLDWTGVALDWTGVALQRTGVALQRTGGALDGTGVVLQRTGGALDMTVSALHRTGRVKQLHVLYEGQSLKINSETWNYKVVNL